MPFLFLFLIRRSPKETDATTIGGFTPAISTLLIHATSNKAAPGLLMVAAALCGLVASLALYRSAEAREQYKAI